MTTEHGGRRIGAGRLKGSPGKRKQFVEGASDWLGPVDYLLTVMRDKSQPIGIRLDCAKWAAPYLHPRLAAKRIDMTDNNPIAINLVHYSDLPNRDDGLSIEFDK